MRTKICFFILLLAASFSMNGQTPDPKSDSTAVKTKPEEKKTPLFGISFSGFIKTDIFFDTRQTVSARDGHFLLYPENEKLDADEADINAKSSYNILSIQTRVASTITGPDALGAKTSGYIEAEFFGNINPNINSFRLRHAIIKLNWKTAELLVGQWWHPMFIPECSPATVSFNTGAPFLVFSRNPQIRVSKSFGKVKLSLAILSQVDFVSDGPDGPSSKYLRNSTIPESNFQIQYVTKNETKGTEFIAGAGINYLILTPRISTTATLYPNTDSVKTLTYKNSETVSGFAFNVYSKLKLKKVTLKLGAEYGENNNSYTMLGGYTVKAVTDPSRNFVNYSNIRSGAIWTEFSTNAPHWQPGIFLGFGKNLGAGEPVTGPYYARGSNIDYAYRISPRLIYNVKKFRIAGELEYTVAAYGTTNGSGYVSDPKEIGNLRFLLGVYYFF